MIFIQKRDGTAVPFNKQKIIDAINKAFLEVDGKIYENDTVKEPDMNGDMNHNDLIEDKEENAHEEQNLHLEKKMEIRTYFLE